MRLRILVLAASLALACVGSAQAQVGQAIAGYDYTNSKAKVPFVNSSGALSVFGAAAGGSVFGVDNQGVAPSVAPLVGACVFTNPTVAAGQVVRYQCDANGRLFITDGSGVVGSLTVDNATASNFNAQIVGNVAAGVADSGNPVKIGCVVNTTLPTYTAAQRGESQCDTKGNLRVYLSGAVAASSDTQATSLAYVSQDSTPANQRLLGVAGHLYDGTQWVRPRVITDTATVQAGTAVQAVALAPTSAAAQAITPGRCSALCSNLVLKGSAGNTYRWRVTTGATAGWLMLFDAVSAPADGAVTPASCTVAQANTTTEVDHSQLPDRTSTGSTLVFSSTGCFTKTASATAMLEGTVQ